MLREASFCVGKVRHRIRQVRVQRALRTIRKMLPAVRVWLASRKRLMSQIIVLTLTQAIKESRLKSLLRRWLRAVTIIQQAAKAMLSYTKKANVHALKLWRVLDTSAMTNSVKLLFIRRFRRKMAATYREERFKQRSEATEHASQFLFDYASATTYITLRDKAETLGKVLVILPRLKMLTEQEMRTVVAESKRFFALAGERKMAVKEVTEQAIEEVLSSEVKKQPKKKLKRTRTGRTS